MRNALLGAAVVTLSLWCSGCSSSDNGNAKLSVRYLGLGDSIAYGEDGFVPYTAEARPNGHAFVGYPDLLGKELFGGDYANLGCPGVTTASYLSLDGPDNGCRDFQNDWLNTLHVQYTGTEADQADEELTRNDVHAVTISLGGNDLLLTLSGCNEDNPDDADAALGCALVKLPKTIKTGAANLANILGRIRDTGFSGQLIYVNLYSTYPAGNAATGAISAWNAAMAPVVAKADGQIADVFSAFADAANASDGDPCAAGLLIPNPEGGATPACDVHPSAQGTQLLADTVKAVPGFGP
ncbi:MAG: GDSL-type esterase/lipase family protein [Pseudomonadota bacterium]